jgi:hypothetical protein
MKKREAEKLRQGDEVIYRKTSMFVVNVIRDSKVRDGVRIELARRPGGKVTVVASPQLISKPSL